MDMPEKLKNMFFTNDSMQKFAKILKQGYSKFNEEKFHKLIFTSDWESKELKARMRHTTLALNHTLPDAYREALNILKKIAPKVKGFEAMVLPDYVEVYGANDWEASLPALKHFTQYASSEFAIRPFLTQDPGRVMKFMSSCAADKNKNIRRFASEGCRPRLPWAMALPKFKKDPSLILPILEKLKDDEAELVRRSVANNLNDISKDNPEIALNICEKWYGRSANTDWIVKHACRGMLKAGTKRALLIFGYSDPSELEVKTLNIEKKSIKIGEDLLFSFQLFHKGKTTFKVRLEYAIDYMKKSGKQSRKIFQISENTYKPGSYSISKKQSFMDMSTRKHWEGEHRLIIFVNGQEKALTNFQLNPA